MSTSLPGSSSVQFLKSPGILNLENARYIILRCPEIESHLLGTYMNFKYSPGIGLFKLSDSNTLLNLRFDFLNIIRKPFHPIGKLPKLTLSFERNDGTLYDFKGVDHVLLISIKYYDPKNVTRLSTSVLNPYYVPDILQYQLNENTHKTNEENTLRQKSDKEIDSIIQEQRKYM